jgi:hypothetical protein
VIRLLPWLETQPSRSVAPLFDTEEDTLQVRSHQRGKEGLRRTLTRHPDFDTAMITLVETGLADPDWVGLLYVMHTGTGDTWTPRYIGKAERRGVKHEVSVNLVRLRHDPSKFARWGYNSAYHLGELSHAVFGEEFQTSALLPKASYTRWAAALFASLHPPVLKEPVSVTLLPWWADSQGPSGLIGSVAAVEYELIALASAEYGEKLLNVQGR